MPRTHNRASFLEDHVLLPLKCEEGQHVGTLPPAGMFPVMRGAVGQLGTPVYTLTQVYDWSLELAKFLPLVAGGHS